MLVFEVEVTTRSRVLSSIAPLRRRESLSLAAALESGFGHVSAAGIGRNQQHTVAIVQSRFQVASECRSIDIQQPASGELVVHDAKLGE